MDYDKFNKEYKQFQDWWEEQPKYEDRGDVEAENVIKFTNFKYPEDRVNSPSHYTRGGQEVIVTIEEAIQDAPSVKDGMLQAQVLKYLLRLWLKDNPIEDAKKAEWYLKRLIDSLNS